MAYIAALAYASVKIYASIDEYQGLAEREFFNLADLATAAGVLGFMDEPFREALRDGLIKSKTLEGVIISGPNGEYAFEREPGKVITMNGDIPRFKTRIGLSVDPFHVPLRVEGQRNVTISAVYNYVDYEYLISILKFTLLVVLAALTLAFFTLMLEFLLGKNKVPLKAPPEERDYYKDDFNEGSFSTPESDSFSDYPAGESAGPAPSEDISLPGNEQGALSDGEPQGLYTPRGNIGWEAYTRERLASELHRCASFEQDLVLMLVEFSQGEGLEDSLYRRFTEEAVDFFILRDLIFERGTGGISVIVPNMDLEQGFAKSEEFHHRIMKALPEFLKVKSDLCLGLSSRSGRLIDPERLLFEASQALKRALKDPASPIVAFKSDPEKYRAFMAAQNKQHP